MTLTLADGNARKKETDLNCSECIWVDVSFYECWECWVRLIVIGVS